VTAESPAAAPPAAEAVPIVSAAVSSGMAASPPPLARPSAGGSLRPAAPALGNQLPALRHAAVSSAGSTPPAADSSELPAAPRRAGIPERRVARFIPAEEGQSAVHLAADGQLPALQLVEGVRKEKEAAGAKFNPLVLAGMVCLSFCFSILLLVADFGGAPSVQATDQVRRRIETYYMNQPGPLAPYQLHLREAEQAHSRGDVRTEQQHYRKVLDLLRSEGRSRFRGLTGTPSSDEELEKLLSSVLRRPEMEAASE